MRKVAAQGPFGVQHAWVDLPCGGAAQGLLVFFGGDRVEPQQLPPPLRPLQTPAGMADALAAKFPGHSLLLVEPTSVARGGSACYSTLLHKLSPSGEPHGHQAAGFRAAQQLWALVEAARLARPPRDSNAGADAPPPPCPPVQLAGFSKGGVILNQLLLELARLQEESGARGCCLCALEAGSAAHREGHGAAPILIAGAAGALPLLAAVRRLHFLDVGLNTTGAYCTDGAAIAQLGRRCESHRLEVVLHGTPRQWDDLRRPWIRREAAELAQACRRAAVRVAVRACCTGRPPDLATHFTCLVEFDASPVEPPTGTEGILFRPLLTLGTVSESSEAQSMDWSAGCAHCLDCAPSPGATLTFSQVLRVRQFHSRDEFTPWWPSGLKSPTLYFCRRRRQLRSPMAAESTPGTRRPRDAAGMAPASQLRQRRGLPQLAVQLPAARTNLTSDVEVQYMYSFCVPTSASSVGSAGAAPTASCPAAWAGTAPPTARQRAKQLQFSFEPVPPLAPPPQPALHPACFLLPQSAPPQHKAAAAAAVARPPLPPPARGAAPAWDTAAALPIAPLQLHASPPIPIPSRPPRQQARGHHRAHTPHLADHDMPTGNPAWPYPAHQTVGAGQKHHLCAAPAAGPGPGLAGLTADATLRWQFAAAAPVVPIADRIACGASGLQAALLAARVGVTRAS
eukprot:scaffold2.g7488.t1